MTIRVLPFQRKLLEPVITCLRLFFGIDECVHVMARLAVSGLHRVRAALGMAGDAQAGNRRLARNAVRFDVVAFVLDVAQTGAVAGDATRPRLTVV